MKKTFSFLLAAILLSVTMHGICYTGSNAASHLKSDGTEDGKNYIYQSNGDFSSWNTDDGFKNDNGSLYTEGKESAVAFTSCIFDLNDNSSDSKEDYTHFIIRWTVADTANSDSVGSDTAKSDSSQAIDYALLFYSFAQDTYAYTPVETSAGSYARAVEVSPVSDTTRSDLSTNQNSFAIEFSTNEPLTLTEVTVEAVNTDQCNDNQLSIDNEPIDIMKISSRGIQIVDPNGTELNELTLSVDTNKELSISVNDGIPEYNRYLWEVSDSNIVSIDNSNSKTITLTAKSVGEATLTATYGTIHKATCTVKVTEKTDIPTITIKYTQSSCGSLSTGSIESTKVSTQSADQTGYTVYEKQQIKAAFFDCITFYRKQNDLTITEIASTNSDDKDNIVDIVDDNTNLFIVNVHVFDYNNAESTKEAKIKLSITDNNNNNGSIEITITCVSNNTMQIKDKQGKVLGIDENSQLYLAMHNKKDNSVQDINFKIAISDGSTNDISIACPNLYAYVGKTMLDNNVELAFSSTPTGTKTISISKISDSTPKAFRLVLIYKKNTGGTLSNDTYISECQVTLVQAGDINIDGKINTADAVQLLKYQAGIVDSLTLFEAADVNYDSIINTADAVTILKYVAGITDIVMP